MVLYIYMYIALLHQQWRKTVPAQLPSTSTVTYLALGFWHVRPRIHCLYIQRLKAHLKLQVSLVTLPTLTLVLVSVGGFEQLLACLLITEIPLACGTSRQPLRDRFVRHLLTN